MSSETEQAEPAGEPTQQSSEERSFHAHELFFAPDGLRALWGLILFLVLRQFLLACMAPLFRAAFHAQSMASGVISPRAALAFEAVGLMSVAIATWVMSRIEHTPIEVYGLGRIRLTQFVSGLGWGAAMLSLLVFLLRKAGLLVFDGQLLRGGKAACYASIWLGLFLLVGMAEEYLFRGYLQFTLARGIAAIGSWLHVPASKIWGFWVAAVVLSFGFGFGHTTNAGESPIGLVAAGLIGMVFCLSLWRTGSLWWAVGFHAAWDWAESYLYGVADSGSMAQGHLFATHPAGRPILSGGGTGPEGSLLILPVLVLTAAIVWTTLPKRRPDTSERSLA